MQEQAATVNDRFPNRAPIPFDNLATYISPGNPNIPFGLGNLPATPGNLIDPVGAKLINAFPLPNLNVGTAAYNPYRNWVATASDILGLPLMEASADPPRKVKSSPAMTTGRPSTVPRPNTQFPGMKPVMSPFAS